MNEIREHVIPYLKEAHGIEVVKSDHKDFNWFIPDFAEEGGTHMATDKELIDFAHELGYITDEDVFPKTKGF